MSKANLRIKSDLRLDKNYIVQLFGVITEFYLTRLTITDECFKQDINSNLKLHLVSEPKIGLVVPTIREHSINRFFNEWGDTFDNLEVIIVEDNPEPSFQLPDNVHHFSWQDIDGELGENSWIIPRRTDCIRSYGYFKAYQLGVDYMLTLDDDCYPSENTKQLVKQHLGNFEKSKWFNTLPKNKPRGIPFYTKGKIDVVLNHGLWENILDYDAPTQLVNNESLKYDNTNMVVPPGMYFPMCGMNVMIKQEALPAFYFLLMGKNYTFDRFGDIWAGINLKKIADHLGKYITTGTPYIHHDRASNVFTNLKKEAPGIELNELYWQFIDEEVKLTKSSFKECYAEIGRKIPDILLYDPIFKPYEDYFSKLGKAMETWTTLF